MTPPAAKPGCERCGGRGGWMDEDGWRRCPCTRSRRDVLAAIRRAQSQAGRAWRMPGT